MNGKYSEFYPFAVWLVMIFAMMIALLIFLPLTRRKQSLNLVKYFKGSFSFPSGTIYLDFAGIRFRLARQASGGGISGGGNYPGVWCYTKVCSPFIIGHHQSEKYFPPSFYDTPFEIVQLGHMQLVISSGDKTMLDRVKNHLTNDLIQLFEKEFSYLIFKPEWHVDRIVLKKPICRFNGLAESIYTDPKILEDQLKTINNFMISLEIKV